MTVLKHLLSGLMGGALALVGIYLETFLAERVATEQLQYVRIAITRSDNHRPEKSARNAWEVEAKASNEKFQKQFEEFNNDGFFSGEQEAIFTSLASQWENPTYVQRGFGAVKN